MQEDVLNQYHSKLCHFFLLYITFFDNIVINHSNSTKMKEKMTFSIKKKPQNSVLFPAAI